MYIRVQYKTISGEICEKLVDETWSIKDQLPPHIWFKVVNDYPPAKFQPGWGLVALVIVFLCLVFLSAGGMW